MRSNAAVNEMEECLECYFYD